MGPIHIRLYYGAILLQQICGCLWLWNCSGLIRSYQCARPTEMCRTNSSLFRYVEIFRSGTL